MRWRGPDGGKRTKTQRNESLYGNELEAKKVERRGGKKSEDLGKSKLKRKGSGD